MQQLNHLKEQVPCVDFMFGFCSDGDKECVFWHPKPGQNGCTGSVPKYAPNECLPQEYLDKVNKYFEDSQISNVNMIQSLVKQMTSRLGGGGLFNQTSNDQFDLQSLLGGSRGNAMMNDGFSNTDTFNNSYYDPSLRKGSHFGGGGGQFMDTASEVDRSNYGGVGSFVPSMVDPGDQDGISKATGSELSDSFRMHPRNQAVFPFPYKGDIINEIKNTKKVFKGHTRFFILKSNTMQNMEMSQDHALWATTMRPT